MNSSISSLTEILGVAQLLLTAAALVVTIAVCLWKRHLSPWLYGIAAGCFGFGSGVMFSLMWHVMNFLSDASDLVDSYMSFYPFVSLVGIASDLVFYGCLVGFIFDVAKKTSLKVEFEESIRGS